MNKSSIIGNVSSKIKCHCGWFYVPAVLNFTPQVRKEVTYQKIRNDMYIASRRRKLTMLKGNLMKMKTMYLAVLYFTPQG